MSSHYGIHNAENKTNTNMLSKKCVPLVNIFSTNKRHQGIIFLAYTAEKCFKFPFVVKKQLSAL